MITRRHLLATAATTATKHSTHSTSLDGLDGDQATSATYPRSPSNLFNPSNPSNLHFGSECFLEVDVSYMYMMRWLNNSNHGFLSDKSEWLLTLSNFNLSKFSLFFNSQLPSIIDSNLDFLWISTCSNSNFPEIPTFKSQFSTYQITIASNLNFPQILILKSNFCQIPTLESHLSKFRFSSNP